MKEKFNRFMQGRYGVDQYSKFLVWFGVIISIIGLVRNRSGLLSLIGLLIVIYSYYRMFSKDIAKRQKENQIYFNKRQLVVGFFVKAKRHIFGEKGYKYFSCKNCKTELRVPKKKGKVKVRCPKCGHETILHT